MNLFCLPLAATLSSCPMSSFVSFLSAAIAPVRLDEMRAGVTDLGRTTSPFATTEIKRNQSNMKYGVHLVNDIRR